MDKSPNQIQTLMAIVQTFTVIVLVIVTIFYAGSTKNMADIMKKEFEQSNRPFIFVKDAILDPEAKLIKVNLENIGKVPAKVYIVNLKINISDVESDHSRGNYSFIYPNEEVSVAFLIENENIERILIEEGFSGDIKIEYWRISDEKRENTYDYNVEFAKQIRYAEPNVYNELFIRKNVEAS